MSYISSLVLLCPAKPPHLTAESLVDFATRLRGLIGVVEGEWDPSVEDEEWESCLSTINESKENVYCGCLDLGSLTEESGSALAACLEGDESGCWIVPDQSSLEIGPVSLWTFPTEDDICMGMFALKFSGNGYFSWRKPLEYARQYQNAEPVLAALQLCRETFPVVRDQRFDEIDKHLGERFLSGR